MEALFLQLLNMSISAGWMIVAVVFVRGIFTKAPKSMHCILWMLVGIRLICPLSFESPLSLIPGIDTVAPSMFYSNGIKLDEQMNHVHQGMKQEDNTVESYPSNGESQVTSKAKSPAPLRTVGANTVQTIQRTAPIIWMTGMMILLLYLIITYLILQRRLSMAVRLQDNIWQCDTVHSPFILGMIRPRIYIPFGLDRNKIPYVTAHEYAHIKHGDHLVKLFSFILLSIYWFNPLIWLAYILLCRDIEFACDERVIQKMDGVSKKAYSETLLSCSMSRQFSTAYPLAFGEVSVKKRIKSVLHYKKPSFWIVITAIITCIIVGVCFLTNPVQEPKGTTVISTEIYLMEVQNSEYDRIFLPTLRLDSVNNTFSFNYNLLSSYFSYGKYEIVDNVLTATTQDGKYTYRFKVEDETRLSFIAEGSSNVKSDERLQPSVEDGAMFNLYIPQLLENASPETSALGLWEHDGEDTTMSWLYNSSKTEEIIQYLHSISLGNEIPQVDVRNLSGPIYGLEIGSTDGATLKAAWWDGYCFTENRIYQVDIDFTKLQEEYPWESKTQMDKIYFPNYYQIAKTDNSWVKGMLTENNDIGSKELSLEITNQEGMLLTATLHNLTSHEITYGKAFSVQAKSNNKWYNIPTESPATFEAIAYMIQADGEHEMTYELFMYGYLPPGTYRLVVEGAFAEFEIT